MEDSEKCSCNKLEMPQHMCIFLTSGKTFSFKFIQDVVDNESIVSFSYRAMSDNKKKRATFYKSNIAGVSRH